MKAIRVHEFGGPEVMRFEEVPDPRPGPGQVLVRLEAIGVNPVDSYIRTGTYALKPSLPYIPGSDGAGRVEAVGERGSKLVIGGRVYVGGTVSGAYAGLAVCELSQVYPLPAHVSFAEGAALNVPYATAYRALFQRANAMAGEHVLVHGATGGVGIAAVQLALAAGMHVIATGGSERGRQLLRDQGVTDVLDHHAPDYLDRVAPLTDGGGVDVIIELAAHINLGKDLGVLARHGRVVVVGNRGPVEINARLAMARDADIRGMTLVNVTPHQSEGIHAAIGAGLRSGTLKPVVGRELPLADAARAHQAVMEPGAYGKIVLIP